MARIRTIKPEAFISESLAEVSVNAERTFFGLLTQADDHGRFRDNPAIINGMLWPLRAEHTPVHAEEDLQQLASAELICRYTGCDGRRYLHVVTWTAHQKIDKPSQSRLPSCPTHHAPDRCGACKGTCGGTEPRGREASQSTPRGSAEGSPCTAEALARPSSPPATKPVPCAASSAGKQGALDGAVDGSHPTAGKVPGQKRVTEDSPKGPRALPEGSAPGSRILDLGSSNPSGHTAPAPTTSAQELIGEYVAACSSRPPGKVLGHLGKEINQLLAEGVGPEHIRAGLERFRAKPMHPSVLASLVNEAMNTGPAGLGRPGSRPTVPGHKAWTNPVDTAAAYAEEL
ncbi:MAG TPA: hypothetical protein DEQ61_00670 [Streptomyces sp.]|nr:hypothetical protein [Streptomyces sp.]